jgi:hypothetical protein
LTQCGRPAWPWAGRFFSEAKTVNIDAVLDVIAKWKRPVCAAYIQPTRIEAVIASLKIERIDFLAYKLTGDGQEGWGLICSRPARNWIKCNRDNLRAMTEKRIAAYAKLPADELPALAVVLGRSFEAFRDDGSRFRVSEKWAEAAARKIPMDKLPQGELDLSPTGGGGASSRA